MALAYIKKNDKQINVNVNVAHDGGVSTNKRV